MRERVRCLLTTGQRTGRERPESPRDWAAKDAAILFKIGYIGVGEIPNEHSGYSRSTRAAAVFATPQGRHVLWRAHLYKNWDGWGTHAVTASPDGLTRADADANAREWARKSDGAIEPEHVLGYGSLEEFEDEIDPDPGFVAYTLRAYPHFNHEEYGKTVELLDDKREYALWRPDPGDG